MRRWAGSSPQPYRLLDKGGVVVAGGIHMSDIPSFPYSLLWEERALRSVANLTREDGLEFFKLLSSTRDYPEGAPNLGSDALRHGYEGPSIKVHTVVTPYKLEDANQALTSLREGTLQGAAVIIPPES